MSAVSSTSSEYATAEEVAEATDRLTPANYVRLHKAARIRVAGTAFTDANDLVSEAVATPYLAALGEGGRRWPRGVDFMAFLLKTIQGIASDSRRSEERRLTVSQRVRLPDGQERDLLTSRVCPTTASPEDLILDDECHKREDGALAAAREFFKDDPEILSIMKGIENDQSAKSIQESTGMSATQYETARRRWRRGLEKLSLQRSTSR